MAHCPECDSTIVDLSDVTFEDVDEAPSGFFTSAKRYYVISCDSCEYVLGSGVAGALKG